MTWVLRSMLYTPGNNARMLAKAAGLQADALVLDLEDAVPMAEKQTARQLVCDAIAALQAAQARVFVRVNSYATGLTSEDLHYAIQPGVAGIMLPKTESNQQVQQCADTIAGLEQQRGLLQGSVKLVPQVESARGVLNAQVICVASPRVIALAFGAWDYARDMGTMPSLQGIETLYARAHLAVAARAAELLAIDSPWVDFRDAKGLVEDARTAKRLGYRGKLLIHPSQIEPVNAVFSPSADDVAYAQRVVAAFHEAELRGFGATSLDGRMIDAANVRQAQDVLAWVQVTNRADGGV